MNPSPDENQICKIQPLGVNVNATFIVDLDAVPPEDMKADDLGTWRATGTRRAYFKVKSSGSTEILHKKPSNTMSSI